jgi:PST family polysaccharide transporter
VEASGSIGRRAVGGAAWSSLGRLLIQALQFAASVVLARLLVPSDFGLLATVLIFSQFSLLFFEGGMGAALVALDEVTEDDLATVFWLNALGGLVFAAGMFLGAPLLASFFGQPELRSLAPVVGLAFTCDVGVCHLALLLRRLEFKLVAQVEVVATAFGFAISIGAAFAGWGVYALALGPIAQNLATSAALWTICRWRPRGFISRASIPRIWRFSGGLLGFNVVNYWSRNADNLLIGKFSGPTTLGYYSRSYSLMLLPVQQFAQMLSRVMFPTLTAVRNDRPRAAAAYRRVVGVLNLASAPVLVGLAAVAPALVPFMWGDNWRPVTPLLEILCLAGVPQSLAVSVGWLYQSQHQTALLFRVGLVSSVLGVAAMVVGLRWGATGVAIAVLVRSWVGLVPTLHYATRLVGLSAWQIVVDTLPTWATCAVMFGAVWAEPVLAGQSRTSAVCLACQVLLGVAVYAAGLVSVQRPVLRDLASVVARRAKVPGLA